MSINLTCAYCDSENVEFKRDEKLPLELSNPKKVELKANCYKCLDCGEKYLDSKNMRKVAKEIDKLLKAK